MGLKLMTWDIRLFKGPRFRRKHHNSTADSLLCKDPLSGLRLNFVLAGRCCSVPRLNLSQHRWLHTDLVS